MFKPLNTKLLIELDKKEESTKSGILLATESQKTKTTGIVLEVGPKADEAIKKGCRVLLDRMGTKQEVEEGIYIIDSREVLGVEEC
jgi:co-chaperonin GroES (HSP10)